MTSHSDERSPSGPCAGRRDDDSSADVSQARSCADEIRAHIEKHLGRIEQVFREAESDAMHIDVHHVAPVDSRPVHTLVTTGMSDRPMQVPPEVDAPEYLELMMTLPRHWKVGDQSEAWYWPIRLLNHLARLPHAQRTWLGWGHTVPNGDPPEPLAPNTKLCAAIIAPSLLVPSEFYELLVRQRRIAFFSVIPIYEEELDLKLREGMEALLETLLRYDVNDVIDPRRRNVTKRFLGIF